MLLTGRRRESLDAAARGLTDASARSRATSPTPSNLPMVRFDKTVGAYFGKTGKRRWRAFELTHKAFFAAFVLLRRAKVGEFIGRLGPA